MKSFADKIHGHVQAVARHMLSYPGTLDEIVALVRKSMRASEADDAEIARYLRKPEVRMLLSNHFETGLWPAADKSWRLCCFTLPDTPEAARRRLAHRWPSPSTFCAWCGIDEKQAAVMELVPLFDVAGNAIPAVRCHRGGCARSWHRLISLAGRPDVPAKKPTKESLL